MKRSVVLRVLCTVCNKGTLVTEDLLPEEIVQRHAALCKEAGLIEIPSACSAAFPQEPPTVFVCSDECQRTYDEEIGPFRLKQMKLATWDMSGPKPT